MKTLANDRRTNAFRETLLERRTALQHEIDTRIHSGRQGRLKESADGVEDSVADVQGDISFSLVRLQSETLACVDQALERLDRGQYGHCAECGDEISALRLTALPFAVRCQQCEGAREQTEQQRRRHAQEHGNFWHFTGNAGT